MTTSLTVHSIVPLEVGTNSGVLHGEIVIPFLDELRSKPRWMFTEMDLGCSLTMFGEQRQLEKKR